MNRRSVATLARAGLLAMLAGCARAPTPDELAASQAADVESVRAFLTHVETTFNSGDLDAFMPVFADDAVVSSQGLPDVVGRPAIDAMYRAALEPIDLKVKFNTDEIVIDGDLAYERGTYTIYPHDRTSGAQLGEVHNRHVHILKRGEDGQWRTWRMMTNSADAGGVTTAPPTATAPAPTSAR